MLTLVVAVSVQVDIPALTTSAPKTQLSALMANVRMVKMDVLVQAIADLNVAMAVAMEVKIQATVLQTVAFVLVDRLRFRMNLVATVVKKSTSVLAAIGSIAVAIKKEIAHLERLKLTHAATAARKQKLVATAVHGGVGERVLEKEIAHLERQMTVATVAPKSARRPVNGHHVMIVRRINTKTMTHTLQQRILVLKATAIAVQLLTYMVRCVMIKLIGLHGRSKIHRYTQLIHLLHSASWTQT